MRDIISIQKFNTCKTLTSVSAGRHASVECGIEHLHATCSSESARCYTQILASFAFSVLVVLNLALALVFGAAPRVALAEPSSPGLLSLAQDDMLETPEETIELMEALAEGEGTSSGNIPLAVIVVGFNNISYADDIDWAEKIFTGQESVREYYSDMSLGAFTFDPVQETSAFGGSGGASTNTNSFDTENDGVVHVALDLDHKAWHRQPRATRGALTSITTMLIQAIEASSEFIDYASYDTNADGAITTDELAIAFVVAGYEAAAVDPARYSDLGEEFYLWSFAWSIQAAIDEIPLSNVQLPVVDGVSVSSYIATAERLSEGQSNQIGILTHELGHYLGLPDLYDTGSGDDTWGDYEVDTLSLMDQGAWGRLANGNYRPTALDAWSRVQLGWVEPIELGMGDIQSVVAQFDANNNEADYTVFKIFGDRYDEYFLVENRLYTKWDEGLNNSYAAPNGGIVIWHVDEGAYEEYASTQSVNNTDHHPAVMPLFVEYGASDYTMIGSSVLNREALFDASYWNTWFADSIGTGIPLVLYGAEEGDIPEDRRYLCVALEILDDAQQQIRVRLVEQHQWGAWETVKLPTATESGLRVRRCLNDPDHTEQEEIAPLGTTHTSSKALSEVTQNSRSAGGLKETVLVRPTPTRGKVLVPATGDTGMGAGPAAYLLVAAMFLCAGSIVRRRRDVSTIV